VGGSGGTKNRFKGQVFIAAKKTEKPRPGMIGIRDSFSHFFGVSFFGTGFQPNSSERHRFSDC